MAQETIDQILAKYGESAPVRKQAKPDRDEVSRHQSEKEKEGSHSWSGAWAAGRGRS